MGASSPGASIRNNAPDVFANSRRDPKFTFLKKNAKRDQKGSKLCPALDSGNRDGRTFLTSKTSSREMNLIESLPMYPEGTVLLPVSVWGIDRNAEHTVTGEQETDPTNRLSDLGDRISDVELFFFTFLRTEPVRRFLALYFAALMFFYFHDTTQTFFQTNPATL